MLVLFAPERESAPVPRPRSRRAGPPLHCAARRRRARVV